MARPKKKQAPTPDTKKSLLTQPLHFTPSSVNVDFLFDPPSNPNHMSEADYAGLVAVMREVGFNDPVTITPVTPDDGENYVIVDGYHRTKAAKELGIRMVPVIVATNEDGSPLTEPVRKALQISMNRLRGDLNLNEVAEQMNSMLSQEWGTDAVALLTGFSLDETLRLLEPPVDNEDLDDAALGEDPPEESGGAGLFTLELSFASAATLLMVKKRLARAAKEAGYKGHSSGLLHLLGLSEEDQDHG